MSRLAHRPSDPVYYIEDCRIFSPLPYTPINCPFLGASNYPPLFIRVTGSRNKAQTKNRRDSCWIQILDLVHANSPINVCTSCIFEIKGTKMIPLHCGELKSKLARMHIVTEFTIFCSFWRKENVMQCT